MSWLKFYEIITKPIPVASALFLFVATSFFLLASDPTLAKLGLSRVSTDYRWVVGLLFIIAATWLVVTALIWVGKWCYQKGAAYWKQKGREKRLHRLASDERRILSQYVESESRTVMFHSAPDIGAAQGLADDGILFKPDVPPDGIAVAYSIQEWALAYLSKNEQLVAQVVAAATRWGS